MSLLRSIRMVFPQWEEVNAMPPNLSAFERRDNAELRSYAWAGDNIRRARLCELNIPGKFTAETLVIYPLETSQMPIFGTEYITISDKKFFGAIDFHPASNSVEYEKRYITKHLSDFPDRSVETSKFYDLSKFFSTKFWIKKSQADFREEFLDRADSYLFKYHDLLAEEETGYKGLDFHRKYDIHMAENDPARGILKAYFSGDFADAYIHGFLFDLSKK